MVAQRTKLKEGVALLPNVVGSFVLDLNCTVGHTYADDEEEGLRIVELEIENGSVITTATLRITDELASSLPRITVRRRFIAKVSVEGLVLSKVDLFEDRMRWVPHFTLA